MIELTEKEIFESKDLSLVKIEQLPVNAAQFRSWRNAFITKTCAIDQTGQDIILAWVSEAFNLEDGDQLQFSNVSYGLAAASPPEDPSSAPDAPDDPPPPDGDGRLSDADSEDGDEDPLPRAQRLHRMCHIPKNPYCDICRRSRMYRRKVTKKRHDPLEARGGLEEVTMFGQRLAADFIIVNKSHANDKEAVGLVIMDEFSGYLAAYPCARRNADVVVKSILSFLHNHVQNR